ncbi:MAG: NlpC/P60 family protein [Thermotaleaceae bacterium]
MEMQNGKWAVVTSTVASLTKRPDFQSDLLDEVLFGMVVEIIEDASGDWYYVKTHYDYKGYIHRKNLWIDNEEALKWKEKADYIVIHNFADIMGEPKYASYPIALLTRGAMLQVTNYEEGEWVQVVLPKNQIGWVRKILVEKKPQQSITKDENTFRQKLVDTALLYLGTQYRWGGKSPLGIDCSGLCSMSYMLNGVLIYRDAVLKEEYMKSIALSEIKPGDLIFFPGHVAMYIGQDKYIHATSKPGLVCINSLNPLDEDYREELYNEISGIGTIF